MPKLQLDGDARGAVSALSATAKGFKGVADEAKNTGAITKQVASSDIENLKKQRAERERLTAIQKQVNSLAGRHRDLIRELDQSQRGFFQGSFSDFRQYIGGVTSVIGIVSTLAKSFGEVEQAAQNAADAMLNSIGSIGQLQQLPDFKGSMALSRELIRTGVVPKDQPYMANDIVYDLKSAALSDEQIKYLVRVGADKYVKAQDLAAYGGAIKKYESTFGAGEAGAIQQIVSKVALAAEIAQADAKQVAISATRFGSEANALGLSDETAMAAFLAMEARSPNEEEAATRARAFFSQVDKRGLFQGDLQSTIEGIRARIKGGESAYDVLGEIRAVAGFRNLEQAGQFVSDTERQLGAANRRDILSEAAPIMSDPSAAAAIARQRAEGELAYLEEQTYGPLENIFGAMRAERKSSHLRRGTQTGAGYFEDKAFALADFAGFEGFVISMERLLERIGRDAYSPETEAQMADYLARSAKALESIDRKTGMKSTQIPAQSQGRLIHAGLPE